MNNQNGLLSQEDYEARREQLRNRSFIDFAQTAEFADLPDDIQAELADQVPDPNIPVAYPGRIDRGQVFGEMFVRANPWAASNAVADARLRGADQDAEIGDVRGQGMLRGPLSNAARSEEREAYTPTEDDVIEVAERWGLGPETYTRLASWAASREDLERVAEGFASLNTRNHLIADSVGPVDGFLMDFAANALRPEFLVMGAGVGKSLQLGSALSRVGFAGAAMRGAGAGLLTDAPIEAMRAADSPYYSPLDAAIATTFSMTLGAAAGGLGSGLLNPEELISIQRLDQQVRSNWRQLAVPERIVGEGEGAVGAAQVFRLNREFDVNFGAPASDAPEAMVWGFGFSPVSWLARQEDPEVRALAHELVWNPAWDGPQSATMYEVADRINTSGGFFLREADTAMRDFYREAGAGENAGTVERLTDRWTQATGGVTDQQAREFNRTVGRVLAGWETSDNPHINRAVQAYRNGFEDSLYYLQDSNYTGWNPNRTGPPEFTGDGIAAAREVVVDHNYMPRQGDRIGFENVQNTFLPTGSRLTGRERAIAANNAIGDRLAEVLLRNTQNREWLADLVTRWNNGRRNTPNAAGIVADPMTIERMASRIMRRYADTWERIYGSEAKENDFQTRPMSVADRDAVREIVREAMNDGDSFDEFTEEVMDQVLDLIAPAKRQTQSDSPRLMHRMRLDFDSRLDGDILPMFEQDVSVLFRDYRRHVAGRAALLRRGYQSPAEFEARINSLSERARGNGKKAKGRANQARNILLDGLGAVTGESRYMLHGGSRARKARFWTQGIARMNVAAYLANTALGPMFAEYGSMLFRSQARIFTRIPAFREYLKAARRGDTSKMDGGFMIADVMAGHGSSLTRARGSARTRFDGEAPEVSAGNGRFEQAFDEVTRKAANMTSRLSGMAGLNDLMRSISMVNDLEKWSQGRLSPFQRRQAGISDEMWERIQNILRDPPMTRGEESGRPRIDDAALLERASRSDPEAWNAMIDAMNRRARQIVQEPDWGHQPLWAKMPGLDLLYQFLSYPVTAATKQTTPLIRAIQARDMDALRPLFASMFAGIGYVNRVYMSSVTREDGEAYRQERLTVAEIGKAMFYYSTVASTSTNFLDFGLAQGGLTPIWGNTRASGLAASPWTGNPTVSRYEQTRRAFNNLFDDKWFSEQDMEDLTRAIAPLGNWLPMQLVINNAFNFLPDEEGEE